MLFFCSLYPLFFHDRRKSLHQYYFNHNFPLNFIILTWAFVTAVHTGRLMIEVYLCSSFIIRSRMWFTKMQWGILQMIVYRVNYLLLFHLIIPICFLLRIFRKRLWDIYMYFFSIVFCLYCHGCWSYNLTEPFCVNYICVLNQRHKLFWQPKNMIIWIVLGMLIIFLSTILSFTVPNNSLFFKYLFKRRRL